MKWIADYYDKPNPEPLIHSWEPLYLYNYTSSKVSSGHKREQEGKIPLVREVDGTLTIISEDLDSRKWKYIKSKRFSDYENLFAPYGNVHIFKENEDYLLILTMIYYYDDPNNDILITHDGEMIFENVSWGGNQSYPCDALESWGYKEFVDLQNKNKIFIQDDEILHEVFSIIRKEIGK